MEEPTEQLPLNARDKLFADYWNRKHEHERTYPPLREIENEEERLP